MTEQVKEDGKHWVGVCWARVIADSINIFGNRITTYELQFPRSILSEQNTHRAFSRNAASTRAIPTKKALAMTLANPFLPVEVGMNQAGMQAYQQVSDEIKEKFYAECKELLGIVAEYVQRWDEEYKIHKQIIGRYTEPWNYTTVVMTTTEDENYFALRDHHAAEPHIRGLAQAMKSAKSASTPVLRTSVNDWHLPYIKQEERDTLPLETLLQCSTARCARVSYLTHDGETPSIEKDVELHDRLVGSVPIHASPTEHQACPSLTRGFVKNFNGWVQYRVVVENLHETGV